MHPVNLSARLKLAPDNMKNTERNLIEGLRLLYGCKDNETLSIAATGSHVTAKKISPDNIENISIAKEY